MLVEKPIREKLTKEEIIVSDILFWSFYFSQFSPELQMNIFSLLSFYDVPKMEDYEKIAKITYPRVVNFFRFGKHVPTYNKELLIPKIIDDLKDSAFKMFTHQDGGESKESLQKKILQQMILRDKNYVVDRGSRPGNRRSFGDDTFGRRRMHFVSYILLGQQVHLKRAEFFGKMLLDLRSYYYSHLNEFNLNLIEDLVDSQNRSAEKLERGEVVVVPRWRILSEERIEKRPQLSKEDRIQAREIARIKVIEMRKEREEKERLRIEAERKAKREKRPLITEEEIERRKALSKLAKETKRRKLEDRKLKKRF